MAQIINQFLVYGQNRYFYSQVFYFDILSSLLALQMTARLCSRLESHIDYPIIGICLESNCEDCPLACPLCVKQFHRGHLIVTLEFLSKSYLHAKPPSEFIELVELMKEKEKNLQKRAEEACTAVALASAKLKEKVCNSSPLIDVLSQPIELAQIPELINYISSSRFFSLQTVKSYLPLLRSYYFQGGISVASHKSTSQYINQTFLTLFSNFQTSFKQAINQIQQNIQKHCQEKVEPSSSVVKKEQEVEAAFKQFKLAHKYSQKADKIEDEQASLTSDSQRHKHLLKRHNLARSDNQEGIKVILRQNKQVEINVLIQYIDVSAIKVLTLCNSATGCVVSSSSIEHIAKMVNLQALRLYWAKGLKDVQACRMLKNLYELRQLCLCQFESCTPIFVNALKINNPKIIKLCFSANILHLVRFYEESIQFLPDTVYHYQDEESWISMTNGLRDLTTLQLHRPENKSYWTSYIKRNALKLTQFTLSCIDQSEVISNSKIHELSYTPLIKVLQQARNLHCLRLEQVHFDERHLLRVVEKNTKLKTFMTSQCPCISNKVYHLLAKTCQQIEQLSIQMDDKFAIDSIAGMHTLKTLILRGCWGIKEDRFIQVILKMVQIKCLALDYNAEWLTSKTLDAVARLPNLKTLNISGNNLNSTAIQSLQNIPYLNTLFCFNNHFSYTHLFNCPFAKTLKKLSISKNTESFPEEQDYEKVKISLLVQSFPSLTHLKLRGFKCIRPDFLEVMPRLICLTVVQSAKSDIQASKKFCKANWIYFNENVQ